MKTKRFNLLMALAVLILTACSKEDLKQGPGDGGEGLSTVNFVMDASSMGKGMISRSVTPTYVKDNFAIYAYKQEEGGTAYVCNKVIEGKIFTYDPQTQRLSGSVQLPIGTYKFVPSYGLTAAGNYSLPTILNSPLNNDQVVTHVNTGALPEIFLETGTGVDDLKSYVLGTTSTANETVKSTLKRAVSRIDVMFIKATKNGNDYTEIPYEAGEDVFGGAPLETIELRLKGLNDQMTFLGNRYGTGVIDANIELLNQANVITMGNGTETTVGAPGFNDYDNIQKGNIINGSAHVAGAYVIPGADNSKTVSLEVYVKPTNGTARTITITKDADTKLPLERNKVTLVKIYVLEGNVFTTKVNFAVDIDTKWLGSNQVSGEVN